MLSLVAAWGCCSQVHVGPFPPISQHGVGHMMNIKPYCEPGVVLWPDFPKCCPANHPKTTCCLPSFWAVFLFLWCGACSSACAIWLLLKLQVAVLICTSQGASLSCWCIILNDKSIKSAWLFLIRIAIIFCGGVLSLSINWLINYLLVLFCWRNPVNINFLPTNARFTMTQLIKIGGAPLSLCSVDAKGARFH